MKKRILAALLAAILLMLTFTACNGGTPPQKKDPDLTPVASPIDVTTDLKYGIYYADDIDIGLPYRYYIPEDYNEDTAYPVFLFLHGAGGRGNDNETQILNNFQVPWNDVESPLYHAIVIVPQCPGDKSNPSDYKWVNTPWTEGDYRLSEVEESIPLKLVVGLLEEIKAEYSTNEDRYYVMGESMGGYGTWDLILRHTDIFAGAVAMCGAGDSTEAARLVDLPIWAIHGELDTTVPYALGTPLMVNAIKAAGGTKIKFDSLADVYHGAWANTCGRKEVFAWLFSQRRGS